MSDYYNYLTKRDYLRLGKRQDVHTKIREDLYIKLCNYSKITHSPVTKILDLLIIDLLSTPESQEQLKIKLHNYR